MEGEARRWWPGWAPVALDALIVFLAHLGVLLVRLEGHVPQEYWRGFMEFIPLIVGVYVVGNLIARGYETDAMLRVAAAALLSAAVVFAFGAFWPGELRPIPISVMAFGAVLTLLGFIGVRLAARRTRVSAGS